MPAFYNAGFWGGNLAHLNRCWLYLQCTSLADLCDGLGHYLNPYMWAGWSTVTFMSEYSWPKQSKPTKNDWNCWQIAIQSSFQFNFLHCLVQPLQQWLMAPLQAKQQWHWLKSPATKCLYHWDGEWQDHKWHPSSSPRNPQFCITTTRTTTWLPMYDSNQTPNLLYPHTQPPTITHKWWTKHQKIGIHTLRTSQMTLSGYSHTVTL